MMSPGCSGFMLILAKTKKEQQISMLIKIGDDYFNTSLIAAIRPIDDGDQTAHISSPDSPRLTGDFCWTCRLMR